METYNGWTNYEKWKVNLEFGLGDGDFLGYDAEQLKEYVEEMLTANCENQMTINYALDFISDVDWDEIERVANEK
jgi:hypothetical protein